MNLYGAAVLCQRSSDWYQMVGSAECSVSPERVRGGRHPNRAWASWRRSPLVSEDNQVTGDSLELDKANQGVHLSGVGVDCHDGGRRGRDLCLWILASSS
eukprot:1398557-Pyramimonas_sp.AAC.1